MTNIVLIKRSATANTVPTAGQLANGEIAINYADGNLFFKDSGGSVQTLASKKFVSVTGNITGGNVETGIVSATGNVIAGNLNAAGLSLSSNVVSALVSAANITTTANIAGGYFIGNGSQLTGLPASYNDANVATFLSNFGSNTVSTTGNVTTGNLTVNGNITYVNSNVVTINDKFINVANNAATSGAANGGGLGVGPVDAEYATLTFNNGTTAWNTNIPLSVNGNVAGSYFVGNGSALTSISGASVTGNVANATYAVSAGSAGSAVTAEQVTFAVQANITGVGTLGNLSVSGNTTVGNLSTGGFVSATGNVTGNVFIGNGSQLTGITSSYGNANVVANLAALGSNPVSTTGNVTGGNVNAAGLSLSSNVISAINSTSNITTTANISANYYIGNGSQLTGVAGGTTTFSNTAPVSPAIGDVWIQANTAIQYVYFNDNTSNQWAEMEAYQSFSSGGGGTTNPSGANTQIQFNDGGSFGASANLTFDNSSNTLSASTISATGNITGGNVISGGVRVYKWTTQANTAPSNSVPGDNWYDSYADKLYLYVNDGTGNQWVDQSPPTTFASLTITGNTASGNLLTAGTVSATGNITGNVFIGNGSQLTGVTMSWSIANSNATMSVNRGYFVDTTGGAKTMTLPTGATIGDTVRINDLAGTFGANNLTVARNGSNIQGVADDLVVSVNQSSFGLVYSNGTYGWKLLEF